MEHWKSQKGQSSLEVIVAAAIISLMLGGTFLLFGSTIAESRAIVFRSIAEDRLLEGIEATRQIQNQDWSYLEDGVHGLQLVGDAWQFSGSSDTQGRYTRTVEVVRIDDGQKDVTVTVSWESTNNRPNSLSTTTRFTTWPSLDIFGNWWAPYVLSSTDIGPQGKATGIYVGNDNIGYITSDTSSGQVPGLFAVDFADPAGPVMLGTYTSGDDLLDVVKAPAAEVVYTVGQEDTNELRVFDVSDPNAITQVTTIDLNSDGSTLMAEGTLLFVGTAVDMRIFDISTASAPSLLSTFSVTDPVNEVSKSGDYAYLATANDTKEVIILDVSNASSPQELNSIDLPGAQDAATIVAHANQLYVGRSEVSSGGSELYIYDRSIPDSPVELSDTDIGGTINHITVTASNIFVASDLSNAEFQIYYASNPSAPTQVASLNMSQVATDMWFTDNYIFISLRSNDAIQVIQPTF